MKKATAWLLWPWVWLMTEALVFFLGFVAYAACRGGVWWHAGQTSDVLDHFGACPVAADAVIGGVETFQDVFLVGVHPPVAHRVLVPFADAKIGEFDDGVVQPVELVRQRGQVDLLIQFLDAFDYLVHVHGRVTPVVPVEQPCVDTARADTRRQPSQRGDNFNT